MTQQLHKKADWSGRDWDTFGRLALGGTLTGAGVGSIAALLGQIRALKESADAPERIKDTITEVPILRRMKTPPAEEQVKNAFAPPGPAGGWGLGAGMVGGVAGYSLIHQLFQMLRRKESTQGLKDAREGFEQRVVADKNPGMVKEAGMLTPADSPTAAQLGGWALWSGLPLTFLLSAFGSRRALEKAFPGATSKMLPSEKAVLPYIREVDPRQNEVSSVEEREKTAAAALLPLMCILGNPARVKSACIIEPWLAAYRVCQGSPIGAVLTKNASLGGLAAADTGSASMCADVLAAYDLCKDAIAAPAFLRCVGAEYLELCPHTTAGVCSADVHGDIMDEIVKTAGMLGGLLLRECLQEELGINVTEEEMLKTAAVAQPAELSIANAVMQLVRKKKDRKEVKPTAESSQKSGISSREVMEGNTPAPGKDEVDNGEKDPVDVAMAHMLGQ